MLENTYHHSAVNSWNDKLIKDHSSLRVIIAPTYAYTPVNRSHWRVTINIT
jgi:hypothetical protein